MADQTRLEVTPALERPVVGVCIGKHCRKHDASAKVRKVLERDADVMDLKCVGICDGPVVVVDLDAAAPVVYSKLRKKKRRVLLVATISGDGRAREKLVDRRVTKKKVVASVVRQVKRFRRDGSSAT